MKPPLLPFRSLTSSFRRTFSSLRLLFDRQRQFIDATGDRPTTTKSAKPRSQTAAAMEFRADASPPGLYATAAYNVGDVILDEAPLFVFRSLSSGDDKSISAQFKNVTSDPEAAAKKAAAAAAGGGSSKKKGGKKKKKGASIKFVASLDDIQCPSHVDSAYAGKFRAMVRAAATYAHGRGTGAIDDDTRRRILSLYSPTIESPSDDERIVVSTACAALKYCRDNAVDESSLSKLVKSNNEAQRECLQIMLIWSCNAFEGGMLYEQTSRVNHSCDANAIVRESPNCPRSAAAAAATKDSDEHDVQLQQVPVQQQVVATSVIEAGDEITISYLGIFGYAGGTARLEQLRKQKHFTCRCNRCTSIDVASAVPCLSCHPRVNGRYLDDEVQYDDDKTVKYSHPKNAESAAQSMHCQHCGETTNAASLMAMANKVCDKVTARLERSSSATSASRRDGDDEDEPTDAEQEMDEQLFHLASSVLGAKHWTNNLMALSMLDRQLSAIHAATLMGGSPPDLTELAECIDTLQRLWDFVKDLHMEADPAHLLSGPTIGIARALVSLGDVKSRKYAAEWIEKVEDYVRKFEGEGMVKVVEALGEAWKRDDLEAVSNTGNEDMEEVEGEEDMGSNKRARVC